MRTKTSGPGPSSPTRPWATTRALRDSRPLSALRRLRRTVLVYRRPLAAVAAAGAVLVGVQAVSAPPAPTTSVWTADGDLDSGTVLTGADLRQVEFTPDSVPAGAIDDPRRVLGATLAAPLRAGQPLTDRAVVGRDLLAAYPGSTAVPVRVTDAATVELLRVGDRVSLVTADPAGDSAPDTLADDLPIIAIPSNPASSGLQSLPGRLVIVAAPRDEAENIAGVSARQMVIVTWNG